MTNKFSANGNRATITDIKDEPKTKRHQTIDQKLSDGKNFQQQQQGTQPPKLNIILAIIKEAKDDSENPISCMTNLYSITCSTYFAIVVFILFSGLPLAMLIVGAMSVNKCPIESKIPVWLIVFGIFGLIHCLIRLFTSILIRMKSRKVIGTIFHEPFYVFLLTSTIGIFLVIWFCFGNAWVFSIKSEVQSSDPSLSSYCHRVCYEFAFWSIICFWIVIGFITLFLLSIMVYFAGSLLLELGLKTRVKLANVRKI